MAETQLAVLHQDYVSGGVEEAPWMVRIEDHPAWPILSRLPMMLTAGIPLNRFKVRDLLALQAGQTFESAWPQTSDVPLSIGEVRFGWSEFEVSGQQISVRLTQLV